MLCIIYSKEERMTFPEYKKRAQNNYHNKRYAKDDEYKTLHMERANVYYNKNKELVLIKKRYNYWKKKGELEKFQNKYPDDLAKLIEIGYIEDSSDDEDYTNSPGEIIQEYSNSE